VVERDLRLVHRLEQARLRLRRGAVDLVGENDVGEERARLEAELRVRGVPHRHADHVGRQHVRGELDAGEPAADRPREARGERRLADAGHVFDEQVAACEEADHGQSHDAGLADDAAGDVLLEALDQVEVVGHSVLRRRMHDEEHERLAPRVPHVVTCAGRNHHGGAGTGPAPRGLLKDTEKRALVLHDVHDIHLSWLRTSMSELPARGPATR
jgi:hypothetical protein